MASFNSRLVAVLFVFLPSILYILYIFFKLDTVGGFFERQEISIKIILSLLVLFGSIINFFRGVKIKNSKKSLIFYGFMVILSIFSIVVVFSLRHGIGF